MNAKSHDIWLGAGVVTFGAFLLAYAIPVFVSSPSNVRVLFLSPTFWPIIISWLVIILGVTLILTTIFGGPAATDKSVEAASLDSSEVFQATARIAGAAAVMVGLVVATPILGMVLSTGIAFALLSVIVMTPRPVTALLVAIILPLALYGCFAHVAGVSVPQGRFLTLP